MKTAENLRVRRMVLCALFAALANSASPSLTTLLFQK